MGRDWLRRLQCWCCYARDMLLEKVYQPDIMVYQEGVLGPIFMIEVVEDPHLVMAAEERLKQFMAHQICYHGALVNEGRMRVLDIFPNSLGSYNLKIAADLDLSEELKQFSKNCRELWNSEKNFFAWMQAYARSECANSLSAVDQETLRREVLSWIKGLIPDFTSLRGNPIGLAF